MHVKLRDELWEACIDRAASSKHRLNLQPTCATGHTDASQQQRQDIRSTLQLFTVYPCIAAVGCMCLRANAVKACSAADYVESFTLLLLSCIHGSVTDNCTHCSCKSCSTCCCWFWMKQVACRQLGMRVCRQQTC